MKSVKAWALVDGPMEPEPGEIKREYPSGAPMIVATRKDAECFVHNNGKWARYIEVEIREVKKRRKKP